MKTYFIALYLWFMGMFNNDEPYTHPKTFQYTKELYAYEFVSEYHYTIKQTLQFVKDLIKICTECDVGNKGQQEYEYVKKVSDLTDKYKLYEKDLNTKELTTWLHYYDENKKDWFHYDQSLVLYYLEQANILLDIYKKDNHIYTEVHSILSMLQHVQSSVNTIEDYIGYCQAKELF